MSDVDGVAIGDSNATLNKGVIPVSAPVSPAPLAVEGAVQAVVVQESEATQVQHFKEKIRDSAENISRLARRSLRRNLWVADAIACNPLEDSRDRLRALEFMSRAGRVEDPGEKQRGKVLVVKVLTAHGAAVEVRAGDRE